MTDSAAASSPPPTLASRGVAIEALTQMLERRLADGERRVWITPRARKELKALPQRWAALPMEEAPNPSSTFAPAPSSDRLAVKEDGETQMGSNDAVTIEHREVPSVLEKESRPEDVLPPFPEGSKEAKLVWLREQAHDWAPARALDSLRDKMVFSVGSLEADLMFVGEAPGGEEERKGEPFVGPAGQLLTKIIGAMGLARESVYISNIVKFRPAMQNQGESNRKPTSQEMEACVCFVKREIELVQPKVLVALGATAAEGLLGKTEGVGKLRGRFIEDLGIPALVTYHPSYLLRKGENREKRKVWEDMLLAMERLGLPISDKQRGYFLEKRS
ncbi:MAG: uracil-DNA glycosylase [Verrucomicrobiota bacterium]